MEKTKNLETVYKKIIQCKEKNNNPDIDKNFPILREYQKLGLQWLLFLRELGMGGILADDMGLGKTLQIISYFSAIEEQKGLKLVIAPKALMYNWRNEFKKFAPHLSVKIIEGEIAARKRKIENSKPGDILISTYGFLNKDMDFYKNISIDTLVIDEAQNIKNYMSKTASCVKEIKADIVVLDMPLLDTRTRKENLTGTFIADLVLQILSYVAETERQSIKQRQREGIEAAKKRGVKFGRPCIPVPEEFYDLKEKWLNKKITSREAATTINVSQDTFLRWVHLK